MAVYTDKDFSFAREIQGSGVRQFSEFNTADFLLVRMYVQAASTYKPLPISTADYQYKAAYLVEETEERREKGHVFFRRTYATVPSSRYERQEMLFTFPGASAVVHSTVNGEQVKRWDRYGSKRPATVYREASVEVSYSLGAPGTGLPTQITYDGQPVDFVGSVYSDDGSEFLGNTSTLIAPSTFIISDVARRWRGDIWERTRITVSRTGGAAAIVTP
jgi:hypothetical protein